MTNDDKFGTDDYDDKTDTPFGSDSFGDDSYGDDSFGDDSWGSPLNPQGDGFDDDFPKGDGSSDSGYSAKDLVTGRRALITALVGGTGAMGYLLGTGGREEEPAEISDEEAAGEDTEDIVDILEGDQEVLTPTEEELQEAGFCYQGRGKESYLAAVPADQVEGLEYLGDSGEIEDQTGAVPEDLLDYDIDDIEPVSGNYFVDTMRFDGEDGHAGFGVGLVGGGGTGNVVLVGRGSYKELSEVEPTEVYHSCTN